MLKLDVDHRRNHYDRAVGSEASSVGSVDIPCRHQIKLKRYEVIDHWPEHNSILVISKGIAGLQNILSDGRRTISALFIENDMIDSMMCEKTRGGGLIALTGLEGHWVEEANCGDGSAHCSSHLLAVRQNLIRQNKFMIRHCNDLGKKSAMERIAAFMFECRHRLGLNKNKSIFSLLLQRVDIADYLGLRQETLSRAMAKLERKGLISIHDGNKVEILDQNHLRQIANGASALS